MAGHTQGRLALDPLNHSFADVGGVDVYSTVAPESTVESTQADAAELVRRWNTFEEGGAVALAVEALREFINFAPRVRSFESESESIANGRPLMASQSEYYIWVFDQASAALTALTDDGGSR